jgi:hypothetical protein
MNNTRNEDIRLNSYIEQRLNVTDRLNQKSKEEYMSVITKE